MNKTIYVLNGPNLNLLGRRQPEIYGHDTLENVEENCRRVCAEGFSIRLLQSNHEGQIIDWIHEARAAACGIVINPAAFTHTSVAILDALNTFDGPVIEVHISNVHMREGFRHHSFVSLRADGVIAGLGIGGYEAAVRRVCSLVGAKLNAIQQTSVEPREEATMIIANQEEVTPAVLRVMEQTADPRLREIMVSLIKHLHGLIREVRLSEEEFQKATRILNTMGQQSNDKHNEFVLMAGSLGVSSLVCLLNNGDNGVTETTQSLLGPFWRMNHPVTENGGSILRSDTPGPRLFGTFRFQDRQGQPIEGLEVDIWHASPVGLYENQDPDQAEYNLRGKFFTGSDGIVSFRSVKPVGYPIPTNTTVGELLRAQSRHPFRPAHVHVLAFKHGFKTLISQIYVDETDYLHSDVQFGVTKALVANLQRHEEPHPAEGEIGEWYTLNHTLLLEPGEAKLPIPPIK